MGFFSNNIGLRFLNNSYDKLNPAPLDNFADIKLDTLLTDTVTYINKWFFLLRIQITSMYQLEIFTMPQIQTH